jgi:hypothetical protein
MWSGVVLQTHHANVVIVKKDGIGLVMKKKSICSMSVEILACGFCISADTLAMI